MLGVTRTEISRTASDLREQKMIEYSRGRLIIASRAKLEQRACECYEVIKQAIKEFTRT